MIVKNGQTIFDFALIAFQDASRVYDIIVPNNVDGINADITGLDLLFTPEKITDKESIKATSSTQKNVTISDGQTLFDIALQYGGSAESIIQVLLENPGIDSITANATGVELNYTASNLFVPVYFRTTGGNIGTRYPYFTLAGSETFYRITESGDRRVTETFEPRTYQ